MKQFKAWIVIDDHTKQPLLIEASPQIFWLRGVAVNWCKDKWGGLSVKKVLIKEFSQN